MARKPEPLVKCPKYATCNTMVPQSKQGEAHRYQIWIQDKKRFEWFDCSG